MKWKYYKENICTDNPVAVAYVNGKKILYVYENRDGYYTQTCSTYLKSVHISYHDARKINTQQEENMHSSTDELSLMHACEYFERDYNNQKEKMLNDFGMQLNRIF